MSTGRRTYIARAVLIYTILALAWIFLSDQLLTVFVDITALVWLSTAKGVFFVLASGSCFAIALNAVPDTNATTLSHDQALLDALTYRPRSRWLVYLFSVTVTASMLVVQLLIQVPQDRPFLFMFLLPIILAALVGGFGPGVAATVTAALLGLYVLIPPHLAFAGADNHDLFLWGLLIVSGLVVSLLSGGIHHLRRRETDRLRQVENAHHALKQSEERFRLLFNDAPVAMNFNDRQGRILAQNEQFERLFGYTQAEIPTLDDWWPLAYPDLCYREQVRRRWETAVTQSQGISEAFDAGRYRITGKDGDERFVHVFSIQMPDVLLTAFVDETAQHRAEEQLRLWAESFEQAELGLVITDARSNTIIAANPAFARQRGYRCEELPGMPIFQLFPADRLSDAHTIITTMGEVPHGMFEVEHVTRDGRRFPVMVDVTVVTDQTGLPLRQIAYVLDITERKRAEQALAEAMEMQKRGRIATLNQMQDSNRARLAAEQAEDAVRQLNAELEQRVVERTAELTAANRELGSFAYAVSHDLRAPLRAMNGFSQALIEDYGGQLQGEARMYLDQIILGSRKMGELIDGLLALSRSTRGPLQRQSIDLSAMALRILATLAREEPERQVRWQVEPNLTVRGDQPMLEVVMHNLIANAWKYTNRHDDALIRVYTEITQHGTAICIADNGAGFDQKHADKLFQPFQRLHRQDEFPGIGIGLATVQRIIHRHGGTITAHGAKDQGATFCFTLP